VTLPPERVRSRAAWLLPQAQERIATAACGPPASEGEPWTRDACSSFSLGAEKAAASVEFDGLESLSGGTVVRGEIVTHGLTTRMMTEFGALSTTDSF
jgi:hypothetical protein